MERGADTATVNGLGRTPLGIALRLPEHSMEQRQARHEIVALLKAAGAPARVRYPMVEGGPLPIDMDEVRQVAGVLRAERAAVCKAAGIPDESGRLAPLVEQDFDSYQDLISELSHNCHPDLLPSLLRLCVGVLGDTGAARTLTGDQLVNSPFFHHGDLAVKGDLDVGAPFVVTGSLTVEGVLADCGPDSVVVVGGGVTARGVFTDGEMCVGGDLEADDRLRALQRCRWAAAAARPPPAWWRRPSARAAASSPCSRAAHPRHTTPGVRATAWNAPTAPRPKASPPGPDSS